MSEELEKLKDQRDLEKLEARRRALIKRAREIYAVGSDDDIEIDDNAPLSESTEDVGAWVAAWVWVSDADLEEEPDEEDISPVDKMIREVEALPPAKE